MPEAVIDQGALREKVLTDVRYGQVFLQEKAKADLAWFCRVVLGYTDMNAEHDALCEFLQHDPAPLRLILMPRYTFKSSIATMGETLYGLAVNPDERFLLISDSTEKAEGFLQGIKNHILGAIPTSRFRAVFGAWEVDPKRGVWNQSAITVAPRTTAQVEPSIETAGIETSKTGKHYGRLKFDDLVSDKNVTTRELMDKVEEVFKNSDALLARSARTDVIGTRWHYGDLYGRILAQYRGMPGLSVFLRKAHEGSRYFFQDIGKESLTKAAVDTLRWKWGSYKFSCLMQNEPVDDDTATFQVEDFTFYDPQRRPSGLYLTCCLDPIPPHEGTRGDDAALTVCGTDHAMNLYVLEIVHGRLQPSEQIDALFRLHAKWGLHAFGVETNAFQKVMRRDIELRYQQERLKNPRFRFFQIEEFVGSSLPNKELRIRGLQPYHERGALRFPGTSVETLAEPFRTLAWQLIQFPKSAKDDLSDSLAGHLLLHRAGTQIEETKEFPWSSAAWFERRQRQALLEDNARRPRRLWQPAPPLVFG